MNKVLPPVLVIVWVLAAMPLSTPLRVMSPLCGAAPAASTGAGKAEPKLALPIDELALTMRLPETAAAEEVLVLMRAPRVFAMPRPVTPTPFRVRNSPVVLPFRSRVAPAVTLVKLVVAVIGRAEGGVVAHPEHPGGDR